MESQVSRNLHRARKRIRPRRSILEKLPASCRACSLLCDIGLDGRRFLYVSDVFENLEATTTVTTTWAQRSCHERAAAPSKAERHRSNFSRESLAAHMSPRIRNFSRQRARGSGRSRHPYTSKKFMAAGGRYRESTPSTRKQFDDEPARFDESAPRIRSTIQSDAVPSFAPVTRPSAQGQRWPR